MRASSAGEGSSLAALLSGATACLCMGNDGQPCPQARLPSLLLPGAFNPLHAGHRRLAEIASQLASLPPAFELSVVNVDKPPLSADEVLRRIRQFTGFAPLWLTRAPTFLEKARLFPGALFVVGLDTAERIVAARYYSSEESRMRDALEQIGRHGCRFLVAGRADGERFRTLADVALPEYCCELFEAISEADFRLDLSSTQLRRRDSLQ